MKVTDVGWNLIFVFGVMLAFKNFSEKGHVPYHIPPPFFGHLVASKHFDTPSIRSRNCVTNFMSKVVVGRSAEQKSTIGFDVNLLRDQDHSESNLPPQIKFL